MMKHTCYLVLIILVAGCRDKFESPVTRPSLGYLVVEGFINTGKGPTNIILSRIGVLGDPVISYVKGANVQVESEDNMVYALTDKQNGVYTADQLILNSNLKYRLRIRTPDNKMYLSDFEQARATPPIDSISWKRENDGLQIYVNTHDPDNDSRYYRWEYIQTWEFHSAYSPTLKYKTVPVPGGVEYSVVFIDTINYSGDTSKFRCWQSNTSSNIFTGTTVQLTKDEMRKALISIPDGSVALSVLYSVLVKQYVLTKEAYDFFEIMRKNTEITGGVFDAQPSQLKGNIHCTSHPADPVIGYIAVSTMEEKRIFISNHQVPGWSYSSGCSELYFAARPPDSVAVAVSMELVPTKVHTQSGPNRIDTFYAAKIDCIDCTLKGTKTKPVFWP